jgi:hypothetical protein
MMKLNPAHILNGVLVSVEVLIQWKEATGVWPALATAANYEYQSSTIL